MTSVLALLVSSPFFGQAAEKKPHPGVNQNRVTRALNKGAQWLLGESHPTDYDFGGHKMRSHELVLMINTESSFFN